MPLCSLGFDLFLPLLRCTRRERCSEESVDFTIILVQDGDLLPDVEPGTLVQTAGQEDLVRLAPEPLAVRIVVLEQQLGAEPAPSLDLAKDHVGEGDEGEDARAAEGGARARAGPEPLEKVGHFLAHGGHGQDGQVVVGVVRGAGDEVDVGDDLGPVAVAGKVERYLVRRVDVVLERGSAAQRDRVALER